METQNAGIDYGMGLKNVDFDTGIRYGVISQYDVGQSWLDSSVPVYLCEEWEFICEYSSEDEGCDMPCDPIKFIYEDEEYCIVQNSDDPGLFITKSPFYTLCNFCSPCAPGAGFLLDQNKNGIKAYCLGHDWFDNEKAPYKVFRVDNNEEVLS